MRLLGITLRATSFPIQCSSNSGNEDSFGEAIAGQGRVSVSFTAILLNGSGLAKVTLGIATDNASFANVWHETDLFLTTTVQGLPASINKHLSELLAAAMATNRAKVHSVLTHGECQ